MIRKLRRNLTLFGVAGLVQWCSRYIVLLLNTRVLGKRYRELRVHDFRLVVDLHDAGISKELMLIGSREEEHLYLLEQFLKPGMAVLDCGANIGYYTVMMGRRVGPAGRIYAVEPDRANYHLLNLNVRLNGLEDRVETFNLGLSDDVGVGKFYRSVMSNRHTFHPLEYNGPGTQTLASEEPVAVPVSTIGAFAEGRRRIDLVRMDIEGYEVEVFQGLLAAFATGLAAPAILFETHRSRYDAGHHDMAAPLRALFQAGYRLQWLVADGHERRGGRQAYATRGYGPDRIEAVFPFADRAIYRGIAHDDAVELICETDWVRAALLSPVA